MKQERAFDFCREILKKVSRSFALTIPMLDEGLYKPIMVTYLQDRLLDNFEDEVQDISLAQRKYFMDLVVDVFDPDNSEPETSVRKIQDQSSLFADKALARLTENTHLLREAYEVLDENIQEISYKWLVEMNKGMQTYLEKEVNSFSELDEYCYYVAGTVGGFLTETIIYRQKLNEDSSQILLDNFKDAGLFLQKVNIIRDIKIDAENRDKNYWPLESLGISLKQLLDRENEQEALRCLQVMIEDVSRHIPGLLRYYEALPDSIPGYKKFFSLNNALGLATLEKMNNNAAVLFGNKKVKVGKLHFLKLLKNPQKEFLASSHKFLRKDSVHTNKNLDV